MLESRRLYHALSADRCKYNHPVSILHPSLQHDMITDDTFTREAAQIPCDRCYEAEMRRRKRAEKERREMDRYDKDQRDRDRRDKGHGSSGSKHGHHSSHGESSRHGYESVRSR